MHSSLNQARRAIHRTAITETQSTTIDVIQGVLICDYLHGEASGKPRGSFGQGNQTPE